MSPFLQPKREKQSRVNRKSQRDGEKRGRRRGVGGGARGGARAARVHSILGSPPPPGLWARWPPLPPSEGTAKHPRPAPPRPRRRPADCAEPASGGPGLSATSGVLAALPRYTSHAIQLSHLSAPLTSLPQMRRGVQPLPPSSLEQSHRPQPPRRPPSPPQRLMDSLSLQIHPSRPFHMQGITHACPRVWLLSLSVFSRCIQALPPRQRSIPPRA